MEYTLKNGEFYLGFYEPDPWERSGGLFKLNNMNQLLITTGLEGGIYFNNVRVSDYIDILFKKVSNYNNYTTMILEYETIINHKISNHKLELAITALTDQFNTLVKFLNNFGWSILKNAKDKDLLKKFLIYRWNIIKSKVVDHSEMCKSPYYLDLKK